VFDADQCADPQSAILVLYSTRDRRKGNAELGGASLPDIKDIVWSGSSKRRGEPGGFDLATHRQAEHDPRPTARHRQSNPSQEMRNSSWALPKSHGQLALRISVSSTSVTVITPGAVCSTTSTAMVSTTGATILRAAFFTGARFGLALAIVRFAAFAAFALRALPRVAEFPLRGLA